MVEFVVDRDDCFCHPSYATRSAEMLGGYHGTRLAKWGATRIRIVSDSSPACRCFEMDAAAEEEYGRHVEYFFHNLLHTPPYYQQIPGATRTTRVWFGRYEPLRDRSDTTALQAKDFIDLVSSSPQSGDGEDRLLEGVKRLHRPPDGLAALRFDVPRAVLEKHRPVLP